MSLSDNLTSNHHIDSDLSAFLHDLKLSPDVEEYLDALNDIADAFSLDDLSYASYMSAVSSLSAEELSLRRSLLHLEDAEMNLRNSLAGVKHEEDLINGWTQSLQVSLGSETAALERKKAQLYAKSKEYQKELAKLKESMPAERAPLSVTELVEFKDKIKKKDQELKLKRAKNQAYMGLPPSVDLARLELQKARDEHMKLIQLRERLLGRMAQNMT